MVSCKSSLPFVTSFNMDIIIPLSDVEFGEDSSLLEMVNDIRCKKKGVMVSNCEVVQSSVVLD